MADADYGCKCAANNLISLDPIGRGYRLAGFCTDKVLVVQINGAPESLLLQRDWLRRQFSDGFKWASVYAEAGKCEVAEQVLAAAHMLFSKIYLERLQ